jgi:DNA modification methylase
MRPYYQDAYVTIYHGDCRDILSKLDVDALITDPPYGVNYRQGHGEGRKPKWRKKHIDVAIYGDSEPFDPIPFLNYPIIILFGANNFASKLPDSRGWIFWDKRPDIGSCDFGDGELIWTNLDRVVRGFRHRWSGVVRQSENGEPVYHPTQKPMALMRWLIEYAGLPNLILDPFMGSGSTLRAAKDLGRKAIGIEIEEKYCEIAAKRMAQEVLDFRPTH